MKYRGELRLFGLIILNMIAAYVLYTGLSKASMEGNLFGANVVFGGPPALFVFLMVLYGRYGLLTFGDKIEITVKPAENMSKEEIHRKLDSMQLESKNLARRKAELKEMLASIEAGKSKEAGYTAGGFTPVGRPPVGRFIDPL
jgi:hypothetical protein